MSALTDRVRADLDGCDDSDDVGPWKRMRDVCLLLDEAERLLAEIGRCGACDGAGRCDACGDLGMDSRVSALLAKLREGT